MHPLKQMMKQLMTVMIIVQQQLVLVGVVSLSTLYVVDVFSVIESRLLLVLGYYSRNVFVAVVVGRRLELLLPPTVPFVLLFVADISEGQLLPPAVAV